MIAEVCKLRAEVISVAITPSLFWGLQQFQTVQELLKIQFVADLDV